VTKIYIYCLFDQKGVFHGVYSSIKSAHRDALKLCNTGVSPVVVNINNEWVTPSLSALRNLFKGELDVKVKYISETEQIQIIKTKLKE
tara:strand:+ start:190 stop:453 length:264 start_codon:yes stop_codon:yes gene_type:complete